jgi:hypothetical protein
MTQDALALRQKIINFLKNNGPSLPVHISKETGLSILFSSAYLSELLSEKEVKMSNMKVGNSPIYFIPGQEPMLENFAKHLKSKEKEAFLLLKEKKFLKDNEQTSAIRVALREIKDFAIPIQKENENIWKYFTFPENEIIIEKPKVQEIKPIEIIEPKEIEVIVEEIVQDEPIENLAVEEEKIIEPQREKPVAKSGKAKKKQIPKKDNDKFFEKVKEFLSKKSLEILNVQDAGRNELILKVKEGEEEWMLVAINKKRITENDVIKAHKKVEGTKLKYRILSLGESTKRMESLINASKELEKIEKIG